MVMRRSLLLLFFVVTCLPVTTVWSADTDMVQIPPTVFGPSGLLFTQSADTLDSGEIATGVSFAHERSRTPDFTIDELSTTLTLGLPRGIELSARAPYFIQVESNGFRDNGLADVDLTIKWRFLESNREYNFPAFGLSLTYYFPAGNESLRRVDSWGVKALIVSSAEVEVGAPHGFLAGFYADGGVFLRDLNRPSEEKHGLINLGILIPVTESRQLQAILELNAILKNEIPSEGNYTAATGGLRYVSPRLSITGGIQHRIKSEDGFDDTNRLIVQASYFF